MLRKPFFIRVTDKLLMAPYPLMDRDGGDAYRHEGSLPVRATRQVLNALNMPETKIMALTLAFASVSMAYQGKQQNPLETTGRVLAMAGMYTLMRKFAGDAYLTDEEEKKAPVYYLNPDPKTEPPSLRPNVELDVLKREFGAKAGFGRAALISAGLSGFGYYTVGEPIVGILGGVMMITPAVDYYRTQRVLEGDWEILDTKPETPKEKQEYKTPALTLRSA